MDELLRAYLIVIRDLYGKIMVITSGARCVDYNRSEGGVAGSSHTPNKKNQFTACDVLIETSGRRWGFLETLYGVKMWRIGIDEVFIHLDTDKTKPQEVAWLY